MKDQDRINLEQAPTTSDCNQDAARAHGSSLQRLVRRFWAGLCRWCFLNIWCRHCYRHVMRLLHRFNLHYAPPSMMSPRYGQRDHWCQWCGLRGHTWTHDPRMLAGSEKGIE